MMSDHLSKTDKHLYNIAVPRKQKREISSSTTLAFTSQLASLISSKPSSEPIRGRSRPASKSDIFTASNKGSKKRALKDLEDDGTTSASAFGRDFGNADPSTLYRSKRKMEEKARLYAAMKRGDYVAGENEPESLIDFDRKWAENEERGQGTELEVLSSDEEWDGNGGDEVVEYTDEYGRARTGNKAEAERMERKKQRQVLGQEELDRMSARPVAPSQIIYGDTVQSAAFNPDKDITYKMEDLARKRDRSATPPEAKHYEADKEIRSKGVGFFAFSKDEETRKKEMQALENERRETERARQERTAKKDARLSEIEKRRKEIAAKRSQKQADNFLDKLETSLERKTEG